LLRDQTRITRARLAELTLKMHGRPQGGRVSGSPLSLRFVDEHGAG
jgi:hypothetical protein